MNFPQPIKSGPPKPKANFGLRNRGNRQSLKMANSVQGPLASRLPSAGRRRTGSGSRHGSKQRATKTRSSLNTNVSGPLLAHKYDRNALGQVSSNTAFKSQRLAQQIYSTDSGLSNLVGGSQLRKRGTQKSNPKTKKRTQPNQGVRAPQYDIQQKIAQ